MGIDISKKIEAKKLYMQDGHSVSFISNKLIISTKAVHTWIELYGWIKCGENNFKHVNDTRLEEFVDYLKETDRPCYLKAIAHLKQFTISKPTV